MRDPTIPKAQDRKKIMFYESPNRQTKLRIRCDYDGLSQSQFFRMMITGYIEGDQLIYDYIKKCKQNLGLQGANKIKKNEKMQNNAGKVETKFSLGEGEVEDIFDIIEMETGI